MNQAVSINQDFRMNQDISLYIHVPFCREKCVYCDFLSFPCDPSTMKMYLEGLEREIALYGPVLRDRRVTTVFFGGGTPSLLEVSELKGTLDSLRGQFAFHKDPEISLEGNPESLTPEKLKGYREAGVNRISIGLQSHVGKILKSLGRLHSKEDFIRAIHAAEAAGFTNVNVDVMFGLPGQRMEDFRGTLELVTSLGVPHISAYGLIVNGDTPLGRKIGNKEIDEPDEDLEGDMYGMLVELMEEKGWTHYEISNFAREGKECRHNRGYWENREYIGLGPGAHSNFRDERFSNRKDIREYLSELKLGRYPVVEREKISGGERIRESLMLGLRLLEGIDLQEIEQRHGRPVDRDLLRELKKHEGKGLLEKTQGGFRLTRQGLYLSNSVFRDLMGR